MGKQRSSRLELAALIIHPAKFSGRADACLSPFASADGMITAELVNLPPLERERQDMGEHCYTACMSAIPLPQASPAHHTRPPRSLQVVWDPASEEIEALVDWSSCYLRDEEDMGEDNETRDGHI
jgi:hypothetical protein